MSLAEALELDHVESHLHPEGSFDVDDHPVPNGREEIWRFTPLKRLRGLHADASFETSTVACTWNTPAGVRIEGGVVFREMRIAGVAKNAFNEIEVRQYPKLGDRIFSQAKYAGNPLMLAPTAGGCGCRCASSSPTRFATTSFSLQVLTNSRYF